MGSSSGEFGPGVGGADDGRLPFKMSMSLLLRRSPFNWKRSINLATIREGAT